MRFPCDEYPRRNTKQSIISQYDLRNTTIYEALKPRITLYDNGVLYDNQKIARYLENNLRAHPQLTIIASINLHKKVTDIRNIIRQFKANNYCIIWLNKKKPFWDFRNNFNIVVLAKANKAAGTVFRKTKQ